MAGAERETEEAGWVEWSGGEDGRCKAVSRELINVSGGEVPCTERADAVE